MVGFERADAALYRILSKRRGLIPAEFLVMTMALLMSRRGLSLVGRAARAISDPERIPYWHHHVVFVWIYRPI